jgi:serine/threonine-protein kinase
MLGRYRLDAQVGQGGMAVVWRGFDTQLRRTVAVKVLHPHLHAREEIRRRFDREAHAVARLHHPHILDVYDFSGPDAAPSYLVTEFIPGQSLRAFAEAHPFDPPELAACCAVPLAAALGHAHAAGVVHRDVKPENVMVREDGQIKLTDFGIAALLDPDEKFTVTGSILGSPAHLAPETIDGRPADTRSDLFSLGTLLYWLACGKLPFHAATPAALLRQILEGTPQDPRMVRRSVSDGLAKVISRLLERDPEKRYQTAAEAQKDLEALLAQAGIDDPVATLREFVQGKPPEAAAQVLRGKLVARALQDGEAALKDKRTSAALASFGRVLALDPANEGAKARVDRLKARARRKRLWRRTVVAVAACALVGTGLGFALRPKPAPQPAPVAPVPAPVAVVQPPAVPAADAGAPPSPGPAGNAPVDGPKSLVASLAPAGEERQLPGTRQAGPLDKGRRRGRPEGEQQRAPRVAGLDKVEVTLTVHYFSAHVFLDGEDLGQNRSFKRTLSVGPHKVRVEHPCCTDRTDTLEIVADQARYTLEPGAPKPARIFVKGAPADAQVSIEGMMVGLVSSLPTREFSTGMTPTKEVPITIGDRSGVVTLQAGTAVPVDYFKLDQAGL